MCIWMLGSKTIVAVIQSVDPKRTQHACMHQLNEQIMQVRCMAAVLLMVGKQMEHPDIVQKLLDIKQHPCKPQYNYASEVRIC